MKNLVPEIGGFSESSQNFKLEKDLLQEAVLLVESDLSMEEIARRFGETLFIYENPLKYERIKTEVKDLREMEVRFNPIQKVIDFLKEKLNWKKLCETACAWWKKNKDKVGEKLVAGLTGALVSANILVGVAAGIIAYIVVLLIKYGLDKVCKYLAEGKIPPLSF